MESPFVGNLTPYFGKQGVSSGIRPRSYEMYKLGKTYSLHERRAFIPIYNETGRASCRRVEVWLPLDSLADQRHAMNIKLRQVQLLANEGMIGVQDVPGGSNDDLR